MNNIFSERVVELELVSADIAAAFNCLISRGVSIYRVRFMDAMTVRVSVPAEDHSLVKTVAQELGCDLILLEKRDIYWRIGLFLRRPVLLICTAILLFLTVFLPTRVLFFKVEGNKTVPDREILEAAATSGVVFGADRRSIRSEQVKNEIIAAIPDLRWVGINTYGCTAVITVSERQDEVFETPSGVSNIVAMRDGLILSATVAKGTPQCAPGDTVISGQLLVSAYTDCGISILASRAEGEIYAQTERELRAVLPINITKRSGMLDTDYRYSLIIGKKRINLWKDSGIWEPTCGRMYTEYWLKLPGGLLLPVAFVKEEIQRFTYSEFRQDVDPSALSLLVENYLQRQMVAGKIVDKDILISQSEDLWLLEGNYICNEMIGQLQPERNGAIHGKSD